MASESKTDETRGVVYCDLDGVIWRGHVPIDGAAEAVADLRRAGWRVLFVTNNSFSLLADQEAKLDSMGIPAVGDVVTSAQSAATLVRPGETVLNCGGPGITEAVLAQGSVVVDVRDVVGDGAFRHNDIDAVIVGFHRDFCFDFLSLGFVTDRTLSMMNSQGAICLVKPDGSATLYREKAELFTGVRALDSARLEHAITQAGHSLESAGITYQHGVDEVLGELRNGAAKCAILIRPVSLAEIRRTADEGLLMPPKSTFFTPKLRTGLVMRPLDAQ